MKTVILCGGKGTRLSEETTFQPKPMIKIGEKPMLWHIMNIYSNYGHNEFILALGYKGEIKEYFLNYYALNSDLTIDISSGQVNYQQSQKQNWKVELVDTGMNTLTGGRLLRLESMLRPQGTFMLTYGDGVANIDINALVEFHKSHGKIATVTAVHPTARFGGITLNGNQIAEFKEKQQGGEGLINGGFFVFEPEIFDYLENDETILERSPLEKLANDRQLMAYKHSSFWQCMDTIRERNILEELWSSGIPPWKF